MRNRFVSFALILGSAIVAVAIEAGAGKQFQLWYLAVPAMMFLGGLVVLFADGVERKFSVPTVRVELPEEVKDDVESLLEGRLTTTHIMLLAILSLSLGELWVLNHYHKWGASWGVVNVLLPTIILILAAIWIITKLDWFQERQERTAAWVFLIPTAGFVLCVGLGVYYTEPPEVGGEAKRQTPVAASQQDDWSQTRASRLRIVQIVTDIPSGGLDVPSGCDDDCITALLVVALVALVIVCIFASAFIQHFWVLATLLLLTIAGLIAIRELLYYERPSRRRRW